MAVDNGTVSRNIGSADGSVIKVTFAGLDNGDSGAPIDMAEWADVSVQVLGTFGAGGTVVIQGSNDNSTFATLNNPANEPLSFTAAGIEQVLERPQWLRPNVTAGDGTTDLTVIFTLRRSNSMRT